MLPLPFPRQCTLPPFLQTLAEQKQMDSRVFSRYVTTYDCGGQGSKDQQQQQTTWIEPLSHGMRHPNALCNRSVCSPSHGC